MYVELTEREEVMMNNLAKAAGKYEAAIAMQPEAAYCNATWGSSFYSYDGMPINECTYWKNLMHGDYSV